MLFYAYQTQKSGHLFQENEVSLFVFIVGYEKTSCEWRTQARFNVEVRL